VGGVSRRSPRSPNGRAGGYDCAGGDGVPSRSEVLREEPRRVTGVSPVQSGWNARSSRIPVVFSCRAARTGETPVTRTAAFREALKAAAPGARLHVRKNLVGFAGGDGHDANQGVPCLWSLHSSGRTENPMHVPALALILLLLSTSTARSAPSTAPSATTKEAAAQLRERFRELLITEPGGIPGMANAAAATDGGGGNPAAVAHREPGERRGDESRPGVAARKRRLDLQPAPDECGQALPPRPRPPRKRQGDRLRPVRRQRDAGLLARRPKKDLKVERTPATRSSR
jgi:hypothetical protein